MAACHRLVIQCFRRGHSKNCRPLPFLPSRHKSEKRRQACLAFASPSLAADIVNLPTGCGAAITWLNIDCCTAIAQGDTDLQFVSNSLPARHTHA